MTAELAALPPEDAQPIDVGNRLVEYLGNIALAWQVATPEERNKLARQMFNSEKIDNRTAVEITPRPDLLPFFSTLAADVSTVMTYGRKRRGSVRWVHSPDWCTPDRRPPSVSRRGPIETGHVPVASAAEVEYRTG